MKKFKKACPERSRRGFTLIELLIVILIIGILATIAIVSYNGATARAKKAATVQMMNDTMKAVAVCLAGDRDINTGYKTLWGYGNLSIISYLTQGSTYTNVRGEKICSDNTLTSATWPQLGADGKFNGYSIMHSSSWLGFIIDSNDNSLWSGPYPPNTTSDLTTVGTKTFSGPSGTGLDIICTTSGCK